MTECPCPPDRPVVAVVGATATGKSDLALALALEWGGEVVNADASQLYRGMDIGTAKLPVGERRGVPHHQIDVLDIHEEASVASYQRHARADLAAVTARGGLPVLCGGSGLYVRAALDALDIPPTDPVVRARLEADAAELGAEALHARLRDLDPASADVLEASNVRRVVRALEVIELTGRPFSASMPRREYVRPALTVGLRVPRDVLDARIGARVERMWEQGILTEVEGLLARGLAGTRTAFRALGYPQAARQLAGESTAEEAKAETAAATRRFARRQESWFRADRRIAWCDTPDEAREHVREFLSRSKG